MTTCLAKRSVRGDGECNGPVAFQVVYRSRKTGEILTTTPGCFRHAIAELDRALAAGTSARVDVESLAVAS